MSRRNPKGTPVINLIDWILNLFRHEDAARAFVAAPEQTLRDAGLGGVSPAQLSSVAATAVPGMMLGGGDPVVGLQRAVSNHYGFAPATEWASNNDWAPNLLSPTYAPSPTFAPQTDLASHNQTDLLSHNATSMLSPEQTSGANAQQGAFNLGFGDVTLFGSKTTASDGSVVVSGQAHGDIVSGDGAVLGNGNDVNNGHISAGTGSNVAVGHSAIHDQGTTNTGSGSVIKDNGGPVFQDVDASGGSGGSASGGDSLLGLGSGNAHAGNAGGGGIVVVSKETSNSTHVGGNSTNDSGNTSSSVITHSSTSANTSSNTSNVASNNTTDTHTSVDSHTTAVTDFSDHSSSTVVDNSTQHSASLFDGGHDTSLVNSTVDASHDMAVSGNHLLGF